MTPARVTANEPVDAVYIWAGAGTLRFSLRSLARHAPWIRKVHLVMGGPPPAWIRGSHPRVSIVRHEDLFGGAPPAANPEAIAWQLFRIPGISRQFLYFDAGFFLGRRLTPDDFMTVKGGNRFVVEPSDIPPGAIAEALLNARFGNRSPRKTPARIPRFLDRNILEEVNRLWGKQIKQTAVSMETLYFYYLLECPQQYGVHEQAVVSSKIYGSAALSDAKQVAGTLFTRPKFFFLDYSGGKAGMAARLLLNLYYWRRSPFEK